VFLLVSIVVAIVSPGTAAGQDEDAHDADTLEPHISDDLLLLRLRPLDLGTCRAEDLASLPDIDLIQAEAIIASVDNGRVVRWSDLRGIRELDAEQIRVLRTYTRLPAQTRIREPSSIARFDLSTESPARRGSKQVVTRVIDHGGRLDTIAVGSAFVGSNAAVRVEGILDAEPVRMAFRAVKESGEPWGVVDTPAYSYGRDERIRSSDTVDTTIRRRGGAFGVSMSIDQSWWGAIAGDFRIASGLPTWSMFTYGAAPLRRLVMPSPRRVRAGPVTGEHGYLRGIALRLGDADGRGPVPRIDCAASIREYGASGDLPTTEISANERRRTRGELRRSGGVRESAMVAGAGIALRRWGISVATCHWERHSTVDRTISTRGWHADATAWTRLAGGLAKVTSMRWGGGTLVGALFTAPVGGTGEVSGGVRHVSSDRRAMLPGGQDTPGSGIEAIVTGKWRQSTSESTEIRMGIRRDPPDRSPPFGGTIIHMGLGRSLRMDPSVWAWLVVVERRPTAHIDGNGMRVRSSDESLVRGTLRGDWTWQSTRLRCEADASIRERGDEGTPWTVRGSIEFRWSRGATTGLVRSVVYATDKGESILDPAPSLKGRANTTTLSGRGCRIGVEGEFRPIDGVAFRGGLDYRVRTDRRRIIDDGIDTVPAPEVTVLWFGLQLRN